MLSVTKKLLIKIFGTISVVGVATPLAVVAFTNKPPLASQNYMLKFDNKTEAGKQKNKYINDLKTKVKKILDEYEVQYEKETGQKFPGLIIEVANTRSGASKEEGLKNYYSNLDRSLRAIDPRLGITVKFRNNKLISDTFYNGDGEIISFRWSADFNNIGTWLTYMFNADYTVPNLWRNLYLELENKTKPTSNATTGTKPQTWQQSLKTALQSATISGTLPKGYEQTALDKQNTTANTIKVYRSLEDISKIVKLDNDAEKTGALTMQDFLSEISNQIGVWMSQSSSVYLNENITSKSNQNNGQKPTLDANNLDRYDIWGNQKRFSSVDHGVEAMNYLTSYPTNLPIFQDGTQTTKLELATPGFYNTLNLNADTDYRDWFYDSTNKSGEQTFRFYKNYDPYEASKTPFNPAFNDSSSSKTFQSAYTNLTSWSTIGYSGVTDFNQDDTTTGGTQLIGNGAKITNKWYDENKKKFEEAKKDKKNVELTFDIRPFPWVDYQGKRLKDEKNNEDHVLTGADYYAGLEAYKQSIDGKMTKNGYFLSLIGIDYDATMKKRDELKRANKKDQYTLVLKPSLSFDGTLDVLQKQYFAPLPHFKDSVKNILNDEWLKKEGIMDSTTGGIVLNGPAINKLYGVGTFEQFTDYAFTGAYYVSNVTRQNITWKKNEHYFTEMKKDVFPENSTKPKTNTNNNNANTDPTKDNYDQWKYKTFKKPEKFKEFDTIDVKYLSGIEDRVVINQFLAGDVDAAKILNSKDYIDMQKSIPDSIRNIKREKMELSDVHAYNLKVYQLESDGVTMIDENGKDMWNKKENKFHYKLDKYGNWEFDKGYTPKLKSRVSKPYYDLIVKDFYTPHQEGGKSETIRMAINSSINWASLKSLGNPGLTIGFQNSFIPFGVFPLDIKKTNTPNVVVATGGTPNDNSLGKVSYWAYSVNKYGYEFDKKNPKTGNKNPMTERDKSGGMFLWSYKEMLDAIGTGFFK